MTTGELAVHGRQQLFPFSSSPYLDSCILLGCALKMSREKLLASMRESVPQNALISFLSLLSRRCSGEPIAYICGEKEFYGLSLHVTEGVLIPRSTSESLVELALQRLTAGKGTAPLKVLDLGTGSGALILALKSVLGEQLDAYGSDLSSTALTVARRNGERLGLPVQWISSNLLKRITERDFDLVVANLPYLTSRELASKTAREGASEPACALLGSGHDGLSLIKKVIARAPLYLKKGGALLLELSPWQQSRAQRALRKAGLEVLGPYDDLAGDSFFVGGERL